jgi:hypothetical protein
MTTRLYPAKSRARGPRIPRPPFTCRLAIVLVVAASGSNLLYAAEGNDRIEYSPAGRSESLTASRPYLEVITGDLIGSNVVAPEHTIQLGGRGHHPGSTVEIAIDGKTVQEVVVGQRGRFSVTVEAPRQFGIHKITIIDQSSAKVIDGAMVLVRPEDKGESREERDRE